MSTTLLRATALALLPAAACGPGAPESAKGAAVEAAVERLDTGVRVLLVGIDGATFDVLDPLVAAGEAPTFARLLREGAHGLLRSEDPTRSPAIWTTIATGKSRLVHGIDGFLAADGAGGERLVTTADRTALALWNVTSQYGLVNGWSGYWVTWPAEPVRGWMLSDRIARSRFAEWNDGTRAERATWPPELLAELAPLVVQPSDPPLEELAALADFDAEELAELVAFAKPLPKHGPSVLEFAWCAQRSYERMGLAMLERTAQPDLTGVFLIATDAASHTFWHLYRPQDFVGVDPDDAARRGVVIPNLYRHDDDVLARLCAAVDPETVVLVVSDHGFESSGQAPVLARVPPELIGLAGQRSGSAVQVALGQPGKHHLDGLWIASGGPVRAGARVDASIYDVAPTVLHLLGLPVPDDMPGRVLEEMLEPDFRAAFPVRRIDSYEGRVPRARLDPSSGFGEEGLRDHLEALGYVGAER